MNNWKKLAAAVILAGAVVMIQGCGGNGEEAKSMEKGRVWKAATGKCQVFLGNSFDCR